MKSNFKFTAIVGIFALFFSACNSTTAETTTVDMDKLKVEVQAIEDAFAAGEKAKDVDAVAAYYAEDATSFNRNEPPSVGIAAIKEKIAKGFAKDSTGNYNIYKVVDLYAEGNMAVEVGSWTEHNAAGEELDKGFYMSYFQKRDGKYVCVRDMGVTTSPAKTPM